jgi:hypothetical protein
MDAFMERPGSCCLDRRDRPHIGEADAALIVWAQDTGVQRGLVRSEVAVLKLVLGGQRVRFIDAALSVDGLPH